jgi:hypothetical protein
MKKNILLILMALTYALSLQAQQKESSFIFNGNDTFKHLSLLDIESSGGYNNPSVPSTCYNTVPYQDQECNYQTQYENKCHTTAPTQQCNWVPGQQVCHMQPGGQQCHMVPGKQVCTTTPPKEVCQIINGRKVCKLVPGGSSCHQQPPHQVCNNQPPKQVCTQQPGHQQCHNVPGQYVCNQVPVQKYVCQTVTKYKQEPYTCYQPGPVYNNEQYRTTADINFDFNQIPYSYNYRVQFSAKLENRRLVVSANDLTNSNLAIFIDRSDVNTNSYGNQTSIDGNIQVKISRASDLMNNWSYSHLQGGIRDMKLNENNKLVIRTNVVQDPESFLVKLEVRNQMTGELLYLGSVDRNDYNHVFEQFETKTKIDLDRVISTFISAGTRLSIKATLSVRDGEFELLNSEEIPGLNAKAQETVFWN